MSKNSASEIEADGGPGEGGGLGSLGRKLGLVLGPAIAAGLQLMGAPEGLSVQAWWVVSIMALMLVWWVTEAVPIAATALIPLIALPLTGAANTAEPSSAGACTPGSP